MDVAIVKYNAGNIYSVVNAMKRLGISPILTDDAETLRKADRVLFPGQGQAREAMLYLKAHGLDETIKSLTHNPSWEYAWDSSSCAGIQKKETWTASASLMST